MKGMLYCILVNSTRPVVGEHTAGIMQELNYSKKEISDFEQKGVVYQEPSITAKL